MAASFNAPKPNASIKWRHFRFCQIQDGGSAAIWENSNGDISAADRPIYAVFGGRVGFSGSAHRISRRSYLL